MFGTMGWQELLLVLAIVALLAGGNRVADIGGSLGRGLREFREGLRDEPDRSTAEPKADPRKEAPQSGADGGAGRSAGTQPSEDPGSEEQD